MKLKIIKAIIFYNNVKKIIKIFKKFKKFLYLTKPFLVQIIINNNKTLIKIRKIK